MKTLGRFAVVLAVFFLLFMVASRGLTHDKRPEPYFGMTVSIPGVEPSPNWRYVVTQSGVVSISNRPLAKNDEGQTVTFAEVLDRVKRDAARNATFVAISYNEGRGDEVWKYVADGDKGQITFAAAADGPATSREMTLDKFQDLVRKDSQSRDLKPTVQARIADVKALNLPSPTRTKVSFPDFSYEDALRVAGEDAQPVVGDDVELIKITKFNEAPSLRDPSLITLRTVSDRMMEHVRSQIPDDLPPVEERLPRNPAVVVGCDGIGNYGGAWRRATPSTFDLTRKIGYESFIRFDPSGNIQPGLAYKWKVEDENRVYTFYLRKGHRWSDGTPFTAHDVVWVANDVMNSAYWGDMDPWMQKRDGSSTLYDDDIKDWKSFKELLLTEGRQATASPARQVMQQLIEKRATAQVEALSLLARPGEKKPTIIEQRKAAEEFFEELLAKAVTEKRAREEFTLMLNGIFTSRQFYDKDAWADVDLEVDIKELKDKGASRLDDGERWRLSVLMERNDLLRRMNDFGIREAGETSGGPGQKIDGGGELIRLNQMLFRAAMRDLVVPPYFSRVKVEAVADEDGDDSHIVRFTFERPNAFFLELTGTFMFYRGIFEMSREFHGPLHISGSKVINTIDILEWPEFLDALVIEGEGSKALPGKRVWLLMSDEMKAAVRENRSKKVDDYPTDFRQDLVDEINRVLHSRDFYQKEAWEAVKLSVEIDKLMANGFSGMRDPAQRERVLQIMERDDMLKRGVADLSDEEVYEFNQAMLRAGFGVGRFPEDKPLVAYNRENALNVDAYRHPRQFATWITRMRGLSTPDKDLVPHVPTLRAWRTVVEALSDGVAVRNPYYYRVDAEGNQLPYLDMVHTRKVTEPNNIINEMTSGNVDAQWRNLEFSDYTTLKMSEDKGDYEIRLWAHDYVGELTFLPVQYHKDPGYAALQAQPEFRHALSMALNRQEIIDVVYKGIGRPAQWSVPPESPYYSEKHHTISVEYNPEKANQLLDSVGLDQRDSMNMRLFPDGRPFILEVSVTPEQKYVFDAVQMACSYWQAVGINAQMKQRGGAMLTRWGEMGMLDMRVHKEGGSYFGPLQPGGYMPSNPAECGQWPEWTRWMYTSGRGGKEPPERIKMLRTMYDRVMVATNEEEKLKAWAELSDYTAEQLPIIGIMTSPGKVVYVHNNFKNVPKLSLAGWIAHEPGNTCPEVFYKVKE